jgi:hypothetical protein
MVVRDPQFTDPPMKGLYVMESSFESFPDAEDHKYKFGVELEDFDKVIESARPHENIYWRKLVCNRDAQFYQTLEDIHKEVHNKPYDIFPQDFIDAWLHRENIPGGQVTSRFFCSALIAYIYVAWGFLPFSTQWTRVTPKMFGSEEQNPYELIFKNCKVNPEIEF